MKEFKFKKIDAFATENSSGNPAGYVFLENEKDITAKEMLQIAKEMQGFVNEVGYVWQTSENSFGLKYYSAEREVDFCGHATIAIMYDLLKNDEKLQQFDNLKISTNRGELEVENRIKEENAVFISAPEPFEKAELPKITEIAEKLNINEDEISTLLPYSIINAGLSTLIVPIKSLESILKISPDLETLKNFCFASGVDIIEVFTDEVVDNTNNYRTRVFAPTFGYIEDPATGSGNSAFGHYLLNNDLWKGETIRIEQNGMAKNFNLVKLQKRNSKNGQIEVLFGGGAITRIEGNYFIY